MAEEQVTEQEILDEVPEQEQPPIPERPDYIPEKFYNPETGEIRTEEMAKSYTQLENLDRRSFVFGAAIGNRKLV